MIEYQGLMLALRATSKKDSFDKSPNKYDSSMAVIHEDFSLDPVFRVSDEAQALLLEGIEARIIYYSGLNSNIVKFRISKAQARKELDDYDEKDDLLVLANKFWKNYNY